MYLSVKFKSLSTTYNCKKNGAKTLGFTLHFND